MKQQLELRVLDGTEDWEMIWINKSDYWWKFQISSTISSILFIISLLFNIHYLDLKKLLSHPRYELWHSEFMWLVSCHSWLLTDALYVFSEWRNECKLSLIISIMIGTFDPLDIVIFLIPIHESPIFWPPDGKSWLV